MRKNRLVKHLEQLNEEDLKEEILHLFDKLEEVKSYYTMELGTDSERQKKYQKTKENIASKFRSKSYRRVRRPRISKTRVILKELRNKSIFSYEMIDIYLFTCETALQFGKEYRFVSDPLYNLIRDCYTWGTLLIEENALEDEYKSRIDIIQNSVPIDLDLF